MSAATEKKRVKPQGKLALLAVLAPLLLLGGAWGLAKAGVLPVQNWAGKNPAARKTLAALGLSMKPAPARAAAKTDPPAPAAPPVAPVPRRAAPLPARTAPPSPPKDNTARVAKILATMETTQVARLFARMPDAEVAPLLMKMKERTAGEVIAALPTPRAVTLTRYLRRAPK